MLGFLAARWGLVWHPAARAPLGLDLDGTRIPGGVVIETAPAMIFRANDETSFDRVAVDVANLFDAFLFGMNIEVVVATLPELSLVWRLELA